MNLPVRVSKNVIIAGAAIVVLALAAVAVYLILPPSNERLINRLVAAKSQEVRTETADQLVQRQDPEIAESLVAKAKKDRKAKAARDIYRDRLIVSLIDTGRSPEPTPAEVVKIKKSALRSLGIIGGDKSGEAVLDLIEREKNKSVRSAGVEALKKMDNNKALLGVIKLYLATGSDFGSPTQAEQLDFKMELKEVIFDRPKMSAEALVILRLGDSIRGDESSFNQRVPNAPEIAGLLIELDKDAVPVLTQLVKRPFGNSHEWTPQILARIGRPAVLPLLNIYQRRDTDAPARLRILEVVADMKKQDRGSAGENLLRGSVPFLISQLAEDYFDPDIPIPSNILGRIGGPALQPLLKALTVEETKDEALAALVVMDNYNRGALKPIDDALKKKDYSYVATHYPLYIRLGRAGSEPTLVEALNRHGDQAMALDYLNAGNEKLEQGARAWARSNGYAVIKQPGGSGGPNWGQ